MANIKSQIKRNRTNEAARLRNKSVKSALKTAVRQAREAIASGDQTAAAEALKAAQPEERFQFERHGYFVADRIDHAPGKLVFNKITGLKDTWAK